MKSGIYQIINTKNKKSYIGSSNNLIRRKKDHFRTLKKNKNHSILLQRAWNKYGEDAFEFKILILCKIEDLFEIEQYFVDKYKPEYNVCIENVSVPTGLPYKDKTLYKQYAQEKLNSNINFGWKSRAILKLDDNESVLKEYPSLKSYALEHSCAIGSVGKALKNGTKCKGFYLRYKE